jgi:cysteinyl-tRNA synthetase
MAQDPATAVRIFNSLTRTHEVFVPVESGKVRIYTRGPTVYSFQHIGNMRAYIFADTLGRTMSFKGYDLTHVINITDVGHLTSDADTGEDKMEKAATQARQSAYDIARFYTDAFWRDLDRLNVRQPAKWCLATEHVEDMIAFAGKIASKHCYLIDSGLYFDVTTVPDYGRLARAETEAGVGRIDPIEGKRHPADFAIWRRSAPGENRQMEWDSPWGRGAPGWHLECSVMSMKYLGERFDIHTGGVDHREIHHPNEIAQNQAFTGTAHPGANYWLHNDFLIERGGKMSKSAGETLVLERLIDRGFHPLAFRLMCLSAHYRTQLEFSLESLAATFTRLKRLVVSVAGLRNEAAEEATSVERSPEEQGILDRFDAAISDDLTTPRALPLLDEVLDMTKQPAAVRLNLIRRMDDVLGLRLLELSRADLRIRPARATLTEREIEELLALRQKARLERNFPEADRIRSELIANGIEVMDGDPLAWEWRLDV